MGEGVSVGAVDIRGGVGGGGGVAQNRESPDFRSPGVGRYGFILFIVEFELRID